LQLEHNNSQSLQQIRGMVNGDGLGRV